MDYDSTKHEKGLGFCVDGAHNSLVYLISALCSRDLIRPPAGMSESLKLY